MKHLPRSFYTRRTLTVAKELLGKILIRRIGETILSGRIVETEAYLFNDPASHSYRGMTERTKVMFNEGGYLYVYFTYGMHYCANIVTNRAGRGEAVLIRALEPLEGIEMMKNNRDGNADRHLTGDGQLKNLTNGPAKLAQAMGLTKKHSGMDLLSDQIFIADGENISRSKIVASTRIGISVSMEKKWRFYIKGNPWVSKK